MKNSMRFAKASLTLVAALSINTLGALTHDTEADGEAAATPAAEDSTSERTYGYDVSWPMREKGVSINYPWMPHNTDPEKNPTPKEYENAPLQVLGNRQQLYLDYMQGCRDYWSATEQKKHDMREYGDTCDEFESQRLSHNIDQPPSMNNFTDVGYKKIKAPVEVYNLLLEFWKKNKENEEDERWVPGNTFLNYWESPSKMVDAQDRSINGGGELMEKLWHSSVDTIAEWTGQPLVPSSIYGIRVYKEGALLASHVDRLPLICSAIINVDQDVDEPWPLEVIGHDGIARNITMEPGDMVLYESHSVIHGRPFPLKGKYFANIFIHFEPDPETAYETDLPNFIMDGTIEAERFRDGYYDGEIPSESAYLFKKGKNKSPWGAHESHDAAGDGDLETLKRIAEENKDALHLPDDNGWYPIHEAARGGHQDVMKLLVENGADVNQRTHGGEGHSVLTVLQNNWGEDHPLFDYLIESGAFAMGPEL